MLLELQFFFSPSGSIFDKFSILDSSRSSSFQAKTQTLRKLPIL